MKTLYLDCSMGAAGDMLTAALLELIPDPERLIARLNALGLPGIRVSAAPAVKCGIRGTHVSVLVHGQEEISEDALPHAHGHLHGHDPAHAEDAPHGHSHAGAEGGPHAEDTPHGHEYMHGEDIPHGHTHTHGESCAHEDMPHTTSHAHKEDALCTHGRTHKDNHPHEHSHPHSSLQDIAQLIRALPLPEQVRADILAVYGLIAGAESAVHGRPVGEIHFHEVGAMDAVADITAVCLLMHEIAPEQVVVSPVHVGSGQVRCAHGVLPVPAPATAHLLRDVPIYGGQVRGELCTPTGAALLKHFATRFGGMPVMRPSAIGYGMGKKDFEAANCVRAILGEAEAAQAVQTVPAVQAVQTTQTVQAAQAAQDAQALQAIQQAPQDAQNTPNTQSDLCELSCNVDDMTPEAVGFAMERLFEAGALDVYTIPIGMKKSRPGVLLCVLCREAGRQKIVKVMFRHTTTIGIRESKLHRYVLDRRIDTLATPCGPVRRKVSSGYGTEREKYEYEDLARIAREKGIGIAEAAQWVEDLLGES